MILIFFLYPRHNQKRKVVEKVKIFSRIASAGANERNVSSLANVYFDALSHVCLSGKSCVWYISRAIYQLSNGRRCFYISYVIQISFFFFSRFIFSSCLDFRISGFWVDASSATSAVLWHRCVLKMYDPTCATLLWIMTTKHFFRYTRHMWRNHSMEPSKVKTRSEKSEDKNFREAQKICKLNVWQIELKALTSSIHHMLNFTASSCFVCRINFSLVRLMMSRRAFFMPEK